MSPKWIKLAADMLDLASDHFGNHGCNDVDWPKDWTDAEKDEINLACHVANGDPQEHAPGDRPGDDILMWFFAREFRKMADAERGR